MKKKIGVFLLALCMCLGLMPPDITVWAASGKTSVSVSAGSVNIGDTVTVQGKASGPSGEKALATMMLSWDAGILEFVSCSVDSSGGGGSRLVNGDSFTITLKAKAAGTSAISLSATDGVLFDTVEELESMAGSSASVTVNNAAGSGNTGGSTGGGENTGGGSSGGGSTGGGNAGGDTSGGGNTGSSAGGNSGQSLSADNSLKSLTISPGTLSPAFAQNKTSYTATVGGDVNSIAVSATPANEKAVVESVSGNENLKEGVNQIKIVVKAENGVTATYTIKVTKQSGGAADTKPEGGEDTPDGGADGREQPGEQEPSGENTESTVAVNGVSYEISGDFTAEDIPADFTENTILYHGNEYKGVSYTKGSLNLLWMKPRASGGDGEQKGRFFVYDETRDTVYPFVRFANGEKYVIALLAPVDFVIPEDYLQTSLAVDEENTVTAYQKVQEEDSEVVSAFYTFYGLNQDGTENWYQYDSLEGTYQRLSVSFTVGNGESEGEEIKYTEEEYNTLLEQYNKEKDFARTVMAILGFVIAVLVIVIINLLLFRFRKRREGGPEEDDLYEEDDLFAADDFVFADMDVADETKTSPKPEEGEDLVLTDADVPEEGTWEQPEPAEEISRPDAADETKTSPKPEKSEKHADIEVIDFNDL